MEDIKKAFIGNKTLEVISEKELFRRQDFPDPMLEDTIVEKDGILYPILKKSEKNAVGVFPMGNCVKYNKPSANQMTNYTAEGKVINFSEAKSFSEMIKKKDQLNQEEVARLTTKDNIYVPRVGENDSPSLKIVKNAIGLKNIDPESYRQRMGSDFSNNMRLLTSEKNTGITLKKMAAMGNAFDFDVEITIKDKKNAINPIGEELHISITSNDSSDSDE